MFSPLPCLILPLLTLLPAAAPGEPFPLKTVAVKTDDSQFFVRGRQEIPRNAKVELLRRAKVEGSAAGEEEAVLEVSGTLELKAVTGGRVVLKDVWIELTPECRSIYLADVTFQGRGGIRASKKGPSKADVYMEQVSFTGAAALSMECSAGTITISSARSAKPMSIVGGVRSERAESKAKVRVMGCKGNAAGGLSGGLTISGVKFALVQFCDLLGGTSRFADNGKLSFEGNNVRSDVVEFAYAKSGQIKKATISGCDFRSKEVAFHVPKNGSKTERISVKDCWFSSGTEAEEILAQQVLDSRREAESSALVSLTKIKESPVGLGGRFGGEK